MQPTNSSPQDQTNASNPTVNDNSPAVTITHPEPTIYIRTSKNSKYRIEYHRDACIGIGSCAEIAGNTFVMDEENKATFVELPQSEDSDEEILAAAQSCPTLAIFIFDKETNEQIFPPTKTDEQVDALYAEFS